MRICPRNTLKTRKELGADLEWVGSGQRTTGAMKSLVVAVAVLAAAPALKAQLLPADDFFHAGAMAYLSNNVPAALERVTNGLAIYPNDEKLKKLEELLKQQQQQQQKNKQQKQDQQKNDQSKKDQQNQKQDQQQQNKDKSEQDKQKQEQQKQQQEKKKQDQAKQQQAKKAEDEKQKDDEQQAVAGQMTPQEAKRLLDAQKNDEVMIPFNRADKPRKRTIPLKDW